MNLTHLHLEYKLVQFSIPTSGTPGNALKTAPVGENSKGQMFYYGILLSKGCGVYNLQVIIKYMTPSVANSIEPNDFNRMFADFCQTLLSL